MIGVGKMEANVILMRCARVSKSYGVRIQLMEDGDWYRTWAFPINEKAARVEGFDKTPIRGNLFVIDEYPGCPYCGTKDFVQCGKCSKLTCYNGEESYKCQWCGQVMNNIVSATDKFELSGGAF